MKRRHFIQAAGALGLRSALPTSALFLSQLARAGVGTATNPLEARYCVMIRMSGGWDVTLGLDPKIHTAADSQDDMFIEYTPDKILDANGIKLGPACAPLMKFKDEFSVINGAITSTTDNGHAASLEYMSTGDGAGKAPHLPVEIALGAESGSLGVVFTHSIRALERRIMVSSTSNVAALASGLNLGNFSSFVEASTPRSDYFRAQQALLSDSANISDLVARIKALPTREDDTTKRSASVIAASFASGTSFQAMIDVQFSLDSHSSHEGAHLTEQTKGWQAVANIFDIFKATPLGTSGLNLFDRTLFIVVSDFARTPALNAAKGKDHNPMTNSVLLAGGAVRSGQTFGSSHLITRARSISGVPLHTALPVNLSNGRVATTRAEAQNTAFNYMTPEPIIATVARAMKVDWTKFQSVPENTPYIASLIKPGW